MEYEFKPTTNLNEAIDRLNTVVRILPEQIEFLHGKRKKSWGGDFVAHITREASDALQWLQRYEFDLREQFVADLTKGP